MKIFKFLFLFAFIAVAFLSCQKELKFDDSGVSSGTFKKGAGGDCAPVTVTGIFKVDSVLTNALFVDVQVNVSNPGSFDIKSDTVNGFSFSKAGSVVLGLNTIRLYPTGKPIAAGTTVFTVTYGTSKCSFDITVVAAGTAAANFTIGGTPGICTGATAAGTYTAGTLLTPANTLTIEVNVATLGTYTIIAAANPANNFGFTGTGVFTTLGVQNVTLTGAGTPLNAGTSTFSVTANAAGCTYDIIVQPATATAAVFTLDGSPSTCTAYTVNGTYTVGTPVTNANTVLVKATVATAGTYSITTNTVNGLTFSANGTLAAGAQTITLVASGTPTAAGAFTTYKPNLTNTCDFTITAVAAPIPPNTDYFPLTKPSWWSYDFLQATNPATDTVYNVILGTKTITGNVYSQMQESFRNIINDTTHYRKSGNEYIQYANTDYYSAYIGFDVVAYADIKFLLENATAGTAIPTQSYTGTYSDITNGIPSTPMTIKYDFKIAETNTSVTIGSTTYNNVIHVTNAVTIVIPAGAINDVSENDDYYYAKGIGLIKIKYTPTVLLTGATPYEFNIKHYKIF